MKKKMPCEGSNAGGRAHEDRGGDQRSDAAVAQGAPRSAAAPAPGARRPGDVPPRVPCPADSLALTSGPQGCETRHFCWLEPPGL